MNIECEVYSQCRKLKKPFLFNSGLLAQKEIIQLIFSKGTVPLFTWELALSPSLGETATAVRLIVEQWAGSAIEEIPSVMLKRSCSYAQAALSGRLFPAYSGSGRRMSVATVSWPPKAETPADTTLKFKGNLSNFQAIAEWSRESPRQFIVDFNGSLDEASWTNFLQRSDPEKLMYVEQPLPVTYLRHLPGSGVVRIFADESAQYAAVGALSRAGFSGVVIKPMRYTHTELTAVLQDARDFGLDTVLGRMVGDVVESAHLNRLTELCSIHIVGWSSNDLDVIDGVLDPDVTPSMGSLAAYVKRCYERVAVLQTRLKTA